MRIDVDVCRDPDLLAAEVRRLQAVIRSGNVATLTDEELEAVEAAAADDVSDAQVYDAEYSEELRARAATLRGLLERLGGGR